MHPHHHQLVDMAANAVRKIYPDLVLKYPSVSAHHLPYVFDLDGLAKKILEHLLEFQKLTREGNCDASSDW